jgi:LytS/YehU family sensor histidine kinase
LQPLVENAIKHGISENKNGGELRITAELIHRDTGDFLVLSVYDTGSGPTGKRVVASTGVGLQNIRERLASYYGDKAEFQISIDPAEGSRAEATFPVKGLKS